jgi:putative intracellular protease/amidase
MTRVLILMTKASALDLLDDTQHASGFWAEEFVLPYERYVGEGYRVDIATIRGQPPTVDQSSLSRQIVAATRPLGSDDNDQEAIARYRQVIASTPQLAEPLDIGRLTREQVSGYDGVYVSGGHGAMQDMPHDQAMTRVIRWILDLGKPLALVCHGQSALLQLRDSDGLWPLAGYRMTGFSHAEELITDMAGKLPFVLQVELERLGASYQQAPAIWGSCVIEDRQLITGQNPYSSTAIAGALVRRLG